MVSDHLVLFKGHLKVGGDVREALPDLRAGEDDGAKDLNGADLTGDTTKQEEEEAIKGLPSRR